MLPKWRLSASPGIRRQARQRFACRPCRRAGLSHLVVGDVTPARIDSRPDRDRQLDKHQGKHEHLGLPPGRSELDSVSGYATRAGVGL